MLRYQRKDVRKSFFSVQIQCTSSYWSGLVPRDCEMYVYMN